MAHVLAMLTAVMLASQALAAPWAPIGPDGGIIRRIVVDPQTPTTVYLSTDTNVFKSTDDGLSWIERDTGFPLGSLAYRLAIDPSMPTTLYAGLFPSSPGVAKTADAGETWTVLPGSPPDVRSLGVDSAGHIYVGGSTGVWRSTDGGTTWSFTHVGVDIEALAVDPVNAGTVYAATFNFGPSGDNVFRSTDGGVTFTPTSLGDKDVTALAVDPVAPATIYATTYSFSFGGVPVAPAYKSIDSGATWSPLSSGLPTPVNVSETPIAIDPLAPGTVYLGGLAGPYKSTDGGGSWTLDASGLNNPRVDAVVADPATSGKLWLGTWGSVYKSTDGAASWTPRSTGIRNLALTGIIVDPTNPAVLYAADESAGFFRSDDGGVTWAEINTGLSTRQRMVDQLINAPGSVTTLYARVDFSDEIVRSTDGGTSWAAISTGAPIDATPLSLATDPNAPSTLYVGVAAGNVGGIPGVYVSTDNGTSFSPTGGPFDEFVSAIAVAPSSGRIYAAGGVPIFRSDDGGASFPFVGSPHTDVNALAVDLLDQNVVLAGSSRQDGIYRSTDGGVTWSQTSAGGVFVAMLTFDAAVPGRVLAATDRGVLASVDGGLTWTSLNAGLPTLSTTAVALDPVTAGRLYVATRGASSWRRDIAPCGSDVDCQDPDFCTTDACRPGDPAADAFGCVHTALVCSPAGDCQLGSGACQPTTGLCRYSPRLNGAACTSDGSGCTIDRCQNGVCQHSAELVLSCRTPNVAQGSQLVFQNPSAAKAKLTWTWKKGDVALSDLGDPLSTGASDWELCVFDHGAVGGNPRFLAGIRAPAGGTCAGRSCWTPKGLAIKYADKDRTPGGMATLLLKSNLPGKGSLKAVAKGVNLALPSVALTPGVTVQLRRDDDPLTCWQGIFRDNIKTNVPGSFKGKSQ